MKHKIKFRFLLKFIYDVLQKIKIAVSHSDDVLSMINARFYSCINASETKGTNLSFIQNMP